MPPAKLSGTDSPTKFCYQIALYVLGTITMLGSMLWIIYEIYNKILKGEEILPEPAFVLYIGCFLFSVTLLTGIRRDRLDYMTPYFLMCMTILGYLLAIVFTAISRWKLVVSPVETFLMTLIGVFLALLNFIILFNYMERLKEEKGILSTWRKWRPRRKPRHDPDNNEETDEEILME